MLSLEGKPPPRYSLDRRKQAAQTATTSAKTKETSSQRGTCRAFCRLFIGFLSNQSLTLG